MVLPITKIFSSSDGKHPHRPILNSIPQVSSTQASRLGSFNSLYTRFWNRFKQSPELYGIINILVTDIIGDRPTFTKPDGQPLGRNKRLQAERFWKSNRIKETLKAILFDMFVTGDGYGWKGRPTRDQKEKAVKEAMRRWSLKLKSTQMAQVYMKAMQDEDLKKPKKFDYIASSTVKIDSDHFDIISYTQTSNGMSIIFKPEEVIHFRLNTLNGSVQGYSPVEALIRELALLYHVKGNMIAYLENGGKPDILYGMKDAMPNSDSFNNFVEQVRSFKEVTNSHGSFVATGDVGVTDLSFGKQRDMEFQNLALWVMSGMLFSFGIPVTRVPFLIGKAATSGDSGGMAEAGYQSMISEKQDMIEDLLNFQLFEEFGWMVHLPRHYKQDEVREAQTFSMNADTVTKLQNIYRGQGKKIKTHKINQILQLAEEDLEEIPEEEKMPFDPMGMGLRNQNQLDNQSIEKEPDNRKRASTKRNVANEKINKDTSV